MTVPTTAARSDLERAHTAEVQRRWEESLAAAHYDVAVVAAGSNAPYLFDDQAPPFRPNPHFAQWLPGVAAENAVLIVRPGRPAQLFFHYEDDYWHQPTRPPSVDEQAIELRTFTSRDELTSAVLDEVKRAGRVAFVGERQRGDGNALAGDANPPALLSQLDFRRARKTTFEIACMREATRLGVAGHIAARKTWEAGGSEYDIHLAFLAASAQTEAALPYSNIVAQNEHAGVLHYQHYDRSPPSPRRSFLIDAGAKFRGYASDITRTYAVTSGDFADLISALDARQQRLANDIRPGQRYLDLHERMQREVGELLVEFGLVTCSVEAAFEQRITDAFLPHGLGHLLGLQTHDVGGHLASPDGRIAPPPARYPALRLTRTIETDQVFTVEPGIYFIPMLLDRLRASPASSLVRWRRVEAFLPFGGIRIEDNVRVTEDGIENLTRDAFTAHGTR
jgi:Xaa-Pro dipeptidase